MFGANLFGAPYFAQAAPTLTVRAVATSTPTAYHTSTRRNTHRHIALATAIEGTAKATVGAD